MQQQYLDIFQFLFPTKNKQELGAPVSPHQPPTLWLQAPNMPPPYDFEIRIPALAISIPINSENLKVEGCSSIYPLRQTIHGFLVQHCLASFRCRVSFLVFVSWIHGNRKVKGVWGTTLALKITQIRPQRPKAVFEDLEIADVEPCSELHATVSSQFIWNFQLLSQHFLSRLLATYMSKEALPRPTKHRVGLASGGLMMDPTLRVRESCNQYLNRRVSKIIRL